VLLRVVWDDGADASESEDVAARRGRNKGQLGSRVRESRRRWDALLGILLHELGGAGRGEASCEDGEGGREGGAVEVVHAAVDRWLDGGLLHLESVLAPGPRSSEVVHRAGREHMRGGAEPGELRRWSSRSSSLSLLPLTRFHCSLSLDVGLSGVWWTRGRAPGGGYPGPSLLLLAPPPPPSPPSSVLSMMYRRVCLPAARFVIPGLVGRSHGTPQDADNCVKP